MSPSKLNDAFYVAQTAGKFSLNVNDARAKLIVSRNFFRVNNKRIHYRSALRAFCEGNSPMIVYNLHKGPQIWNVFRCRNVTKCSANELCTSSSHCAAENHFYFILGFLIHCITLYGSTVALLKWQFELKCTKKINSSKRFEWFWVAYMRLVKDMVINVQVSLYGVVFSAMMTSSNGNIFRVTGHLRREFTGHWWIPRTKASDADLWCFLWSVPK